MTTHRLRVGLIGCSDHAVDEKARALIQAGAEIVAVADMNERRLRNAVEFVADPARRRPTAYQSATALLEREVGLDAVVVVLPSRLHRDVALKALDRRLNVHVEKPFTDSLPEAREVATLAAANGLIADVGYQKRACVERLAGDVKDGLIGRVLRARAIWVRPATDRIDIPRSLWDHASGGAIADLGSHLVDTALRFVDAPPRAVMALASSEQGIAIHGDEFVAEDSVTALIACEGRVALELWVAWAADVEHEQIRLELHGTTGRLAIPLPGPPVDDPDALRPTLRQRDGTTRRLDPLMTNVEGHVEAMKRFLAMCGGMHPPLQRRELLGTRAALDALKRSAADGGRQVAVDF